MPRITLPRQVGIVVQAARTAQGLTQAEVAERAGVSRQLVNRLEVGSATGIALDKLLTILDSVGCTLDVSATDNVANLDFGPPSVPTTQPDFDPLGMYDLDMTLFDPPQGR